MLVFQTSLQLGRTRQAHTALLGLHATAEELRRSGASDDAACFADRRSDCLRALISVLHERSCLHQLASLPFVGALHKEFHGALTYHARSAEVSPASGRPSAYQVAYALHVRDKDYKRAANSMFHLATRLEDDRLRKPRLPPDEARARLGAIANAYGACLAALDLLPPLGRFLLEVVDGGQPDAKLGAALAARAGGGGGGGDGVTAQLVYVTGIDSHGPTSESESVDDLARRLHGELAMRPGGGADSIRKPVQAYELRQRRALALGRLALLDGRQRAAAATGDEAEPMAIACADESGATDNSDVAQAAAVVEGLLGCLAFDDAAALALAFSRELGAHALVCCARGLYEVGTLGGLPRVVQAIAARAIELEHDGAANEALAEWARLQRLLAQHDGEVRCASCDSARPPAGTGGPVRSRAVACGHVRSRAVAFGVRPSVVTCGHWRSLVVTPAVTGDQLRALGRCGARGAPLRPQAAPRRPGWHDGVAARVVWCRAATHRRRTPAAHLRRQEAGGGRRRRWGDGGGRAARAGALTWAVARQVPRRQGGAAAARDARRRRRRGGGAAAAGGGGGAAAGESARGGAAPLHAVTCRHMPSHAATCRHMPSRAVTCCHIRYRRVGSRTSCAWRTPAAGRCGATRRPSASRCSRRTRRPTSGRTMRLSSSCAWRCGR